MKKRVLNLRHMVFVKSKILRRAKFCETNRKHHKVIFAQDDYFGCEELPFIFNKINFLNIYTQLASVTIWIAYMIVLHVMSPIQFFSKNWLNPFKWLSCYIKCFNCHFSVDRLEHLRQEFINYWFWCLAVDLESKEWRGTENVEDLEAFKSQLFWAVVKV